MKMFVRTALMMSAALLLGGCEVASEIGKPCTLVRKATPEERAAGSDVAVAILEKEIAAKQDFISFGSVNCEDLICVRDQDYPRALNEDGSLNENAPAMGYCSKPCVEGASSCDVTDTDDVNPDLPGRMSCRPMLLDQDTLDALRSADEAFYRRTFGENNSPFFCAGALIPD